MVTVALAGATTGFGLTMLRQFIHYNKHENKHHIVLLSRTQQPDLAAQGVDVRPVDYSNHTQLVNALRDVHTLLSTVGGQGLLESQLALLKAAQEAGVKRWAPSEYAGSGYEGVDLYQPKAAVWEATTQSGLEYTRFSCGLFMSILATGTPKPPTEVGVREGAKSGEEEGLSGLRPWNFVVNVRAGTADYALDGHAPLAWTDMRDIARFVWRSLDLEKWPVESSMRGDVQSFRDIVGMLEKIQGRKFLVRENSLEKLEREAEVPRMRFYNQARILLAKGWAMVGDELNAAFPDVTTVKCEDFLHKWWDGVELGEPAWTENQAFGKADM